MKDESAASYDHDPHDLPFPQVPRIEPASWWDYQTFREAFLADIHDAEDNAALRAFGKLQASLVHEAGRPWPYTYMDGTAHYLQAALADLRFQQGFLDSLCDRTEDDREADREQYAGDEERVKRHDALCRLANRASAKIRALADELEKEVGGWEFVRRPRSPFE